MICVAVLNWHIVNFNLVLIKEITYINSHTVPSAQLIPIFSILIYLWLFWNKMFCLKPYPCATIEKKYRCCMVGNQSLWVLLSHWRFLCSVSACWNCNVLFYIQITCICQCGSLGRDVLHMRHRPICITGLGCLTPWYSYHKLFVLGIATPVSV